MELSLKLCKCVVMKYDCILDVLDACVYIM